MTIRLVCGDGSGVRVSNEYFNRSVFNNPDIAVARSYTLKCKARPQVVSALLDWMEGLSEKVTITEDNFGELQDLCKELGFTGLAEEFRAFRGENRSDLVDLREFLQLKEHVTRQDKLLIEIQRQLSEVLSWKRRTETETPESVSRQFQSLERKVDDVARICEQRNVEVSRKTEQALTNCAKQSDLEELARDMAQLKEDEEKTPTMMWGGEFVYDETKQFDGIIAHLTRDCGGNVHRKGIVCVMGTGDGHEYAAELDEKNRYDSSCEGSWICYDFKERRVIPTSYSVNLRYFRGWVIEVSNTGYSWAEIDHQEYGNDLYNKKVIANFKISPVPSESFRFFRLRQTGKKLEKDLDFVLTILEIFGTLFVPDSPKKVEHPRPAKQEFVYHADREGLFPPPLFLPKLDGIIAHLTRECGGNVHYKGIVRVMTEERYHSPGNVVELGTDSYYKSDNKENSWICYDFKERRVIPTSYSIRSYKWRSNGYHLKSWIIEVSNDMRSWTEIDRQENNNDLNDNEVTANFKISRVPSEGVRFFCLRQTGKNHGGMDFLTLSSLEIFGTLFEK